MERVVAGKKAGFSTVLSGAITPEMLARNDNRQGIENDRLRRECLTQPILDGLAKFMKAASEEVVGPFD
jgi:hypothetical protein